MQYRVLVQNHNNLFTAAVLGFPDVVAEGHTRDEAIARARQALTRRLADAELVTIEVFTAEPEGSSNSWLRQAGRFKDDPTFDDFLDVLAADRRVMNERAA